MTRRNARSKCAPGRIRTCGTRFRKPLLYPLSYEGGRAQGYLAEDLVGAWVAAR
jgi:hypothetical protein